MEVECVNVKRKTLSKNVIIPCFCNKCENKLRWQCIFNLYKIKLDIRLILNFKLVSSQLITKAHFGLLLLY